MRYRNVVDIDACERHVERQEARERKVEGKVAREVREKHAGEGGRVWTPKRRGEFVKDARRQAENARH